MTAAAEFGRCPVCRQTVTPDHNERIKTHRDGIGAKCRYGTGLPYKTTHQEEYA